MKRKCHAETQVPLTKELVIPRCQDAGQWRWSTHGAWSQLRALRFIWFYRVDIPKLLFKRHSKPQRQQFPFRLLHNEQAIACHVGVDSESTWLAFKRARVCTRAYVHTHAHVHVLLLLFCFHWKRLDFLSKWWFYTEKYDTFLPSRFSPHMYTLLHSLAFCHWVFQTKPVIGRGRYLREWRPTRT